MFGVLILTQRRELVRNKNFVKSCKICLHYNLFCIDLLNSSDSIIY